MRFRVTLISLCILCCTVQCSVIYSTYYSLARLVVFYDFLCHKAIRDNDDSFIDGSIRSELVDDEKRGVSFFFFDFVLHQIP